MNNMTAIAKSSAVTTENFLASHSDWFRTGKKEYKIHGMMVSKDTMFHNPLEDTDYTAKDDGITVVLKGTVEEQWTAKLEKVLKTYTNEDGTELSPEAFAKKDEFIVLKTKSEPDTNFAIQVPNDMVVEVKTSWGDVLYTNLPGIPHGDGDYILCRAGENGPDLSDIWTVNGEIFSSTYRH